MKGIIIVNGYINSNSELNQALRLKEEFSLLGVSIDIKKNNDFLCYISQNNLHCKVNDYDFCVYLDKDKYVLNALSKIGIKIFNSPKNIQLCDDKFLTLLELANHGIDIPTTLPGVLCYYPNATVQPEILNNVEQQLNYPIVVKECYGSLGKGVYLCDNRAELEQIAEKLRLLPHIFQQFIASSRGKDVRTIVVGGKYVGCMLRENSADFRSNVEVGGVGKPYNPDEKFIKVSEKVAKILNLDYCGIDLLIGEDDTPIVCEVNSNAFFGTFEKTTKINVAQIYAKYIIENIKDKKRC